MVEERSSTAGAVVDRDPDVGKKADEPKKADVAMKPSGRSSAALVTALGSLLLGYCSITKEPVDATSRDGYSILQKALEQTIEDSKKNHDDLVALRKSFEDYVRAKEGDKNVHEDTAEEPMAVQKVTVLVAPGAVDAGAPLPVALASAAPKASPPRSAEPPPPPPPAAPPVSVTLPGVDTMKTTLSPPTLYDVEKRNAK